MKNLYKSIPLTGLMLLLATAVGARTMMEHPAELVHRSASVVPFGGAGEWGSAERGGGNDECATATMINIAAECNGSLATYDATDATQSRAAALCNEYASVEARDLWFSFVATSNISVIRVEGFGSYDPVVEGFTGDCSDLESIGCVDATYPEAGENTVETLTMATTVDNTYFVRVYSYWNPVPTDFTFSLCAFTGADVPANDLCTSASPELLTVGSSISFTGDNTDALDTEGLGYGSVWHAFTTTECADVTVDYCGTSPAFGNSLLRLFTTCPGDEHVSASDFDEVTCPDGNVTMHWNYLPSGTYYYAVINDEVSDPDAVGAYMINVSATSFAPGYCEASTTEQCDEYISRVTVGAVDNASGCTQGVTADYTDQVVGLEQGEALPITVVNGPLYDPSDAVGVWVDWDQDENFCEANEYHAMATSDAGLTFTGLVNAPMDAVLGSTRMRVRMVYDRFPMACGVADYGEVEDYTVQVGLGNSIAEQERSYWEVFPNPGTGDFTIRSRSHTDEVSIALLDVAGRVLIQERRQVLQGQQINCDWAGTLAAGAYVLRLISADERWERRVVVQ